MEGSRAVKVREDSRERRGPHPQPRIVVRADPAAWEVVRSRTALMPVGAVPDEFAAMIKREEGYDPANGEYRYVERKPTLQVAKGRMANCIECHRRMKAQDFLFRTYLKPE